MLNNHADQPSSPVLLLSITEQSNLQNETVVDTLPSTESAESNGKRRQITKFSHGSRHGHMHSRLCSMLAILLAKTEGTKIVMGSQLVTSSLDELRNWQKNFLPIWWWKWRDNVRICLLRKR